MASRTDFPVRRVLDEVYLFRDRVPDVKDVHVTA